MTHSSGMEEVDLTDLKSGDVILVNGFFVNFDSGSRRDLSEQVSWVGGPTRYEVCNGSYAILRFTDCRGWITSIEMPMGTKICRRKRILTEAEKLANAEKEIASLKDRMNVLEKAKVGLGSGTVVATGSPHTRRYCLPGCTRCCVGGTGH